MYIVFHAFFPIQLEIFIFMKSQFPIIVIQLLFSHALMQAPKLAASGAGCSSNKATALRQSL